MQLLFPLWLKTRLRITHHSCPEEFWDRKTSCAHWHSLDSWERKCTTKKCPSWSVKITVVVVGGKRGWGMVVVSRQWPVQLASDCFPPQHDHPERARPSWAEIQERDLRLLHRLAGRLRLSGSPGGGASLITLSHQVSQRDFSGSPECCKGALNEPVP